MTTLIIAARSITRNYRRSLMTISAIAVGTMCLLMLGEFISQIFVALETQNVIRSGHIALFRRGYFEYGGGNPAAYGIGNYQSVIGWIRKDPVLKPMLNVVTPTVNLFGIAGNFDAASSRTFVGLGVIPADYNRMHRWNEHGLKLPSDKDPPMNESEVTHGFIGTGLARILGLCGPLKLGDCPKRKGGDGGSAPAPSGKKRDFSALAEEAAPAPREAAGGSAPRLDLLAATANGAPNVVSFYVDRAVKQGIKEYNDAFILMNFKLAQQLLYGRGEPKAVSIVVQLNRTEDIPVARRRIETLLKERGADLEIKELTQLRPFYTQAVGMFKAIFSFISVVMGVIVLFTVINTMTMSVMERTHEIGTLRALGVKKRGIALQFMLEGMLLGGIGASLGILLGSIAADIVNHSGMMWDPPGQAYPIPLLLRTSGVGCLLMGIWAGLCAMSAMAAWIPAKRAARMKIVDALGHI
jgi:putative ABC transport system permease protein